MCRKSLNCKTVCWVRRLTVKESVKSVNIWYFWPILYDIVVFLVLMLTNIGSVSKTEHS